MPNLREHIDSCLRKRIPLKTCVLVNFWMGMKSVIAGDLNADVKEVDLSLLTEKELGVLDVNWEKANWKKEDADLVTKGRAIINEEKMRKQANMLNRKV